MRKLRYAINDLFFGCGADYPDYHALLEANSAIRDGDLKANSYLE